VTLFIPDLLSSEKEATYHSIFLACKNSWSRCTEDTAADNCRFVEGTYKLQCTTEKHVIADANFLVKFPISSTSRKFHKLNLLLVSRQVHYVLGWFGTDNPTILAELPSREINP